MNHVISWHTNLKTFVKIGQDIFCDGMKVKVLEVDENCVLVQKSDGCKVRVEKHDIHNIKQFENGTLKMSVKTTDFIP